MKHKIRLLKNRHGFTIQFTSRLYFDIDRSNWWFLPNVELDIRGALDRFIVSFLCFSFTFYRWKNFDRREK